MDHFHNSDPDVESSGDCCDVCTCAANKDDGCEAKPELISKQISWRPISRTRHLLNFRTSSTLLCLITQHGDVST